MRSNIDNIDNWLLYVIRTDDQFAFNNIDTSFESAVGSLVKYSNLIADDLEIEELFRVLILLINHTREYLNSSNLDEKDLRLKFLDKFEFLVRKNLSFNSSSNKLLKWAGDKELLAEFFVQLKLITSKDKKSLFDNSYEDIAHFLKNNFLAYEKTQISTILGVLKKLPKKISENQGHVDIKLK